MIKRFLDLELFKDYANKEYKIKTVHKIFGETIAKVSINGLIDESDRVGVIVHGKEIYCRKENENCVSVFENGIVMSDSLMKIFISLYS